MNLTANFKTSTSTGELSAHSFSVYPNPVSDYLYIGIDNTALSLNSHSITVTLYDITGKLALKSPIKDGKVIYRASPPEFTICLLNTTVKPLIKR